jgi:hypothetical protein
MTVGQASHKATKRKPDPAPGDPVDEDAFSVLGLDRSSQMRNTLVKGLFDRKRKNPDDPGAK